MGWKFPCQHGDGFLVRESSMTAECRHGWNPIDDTDRRSIADAMEMQAKVPEKLRSAFVTRLLDAAQQVEDGGKEDPLWVFVNATAAQRCDAAIAVLEAQCRK